jgi:hypothetical protein
MTLPGKEFSKLLDACSGLPAADVIGEESYVYEDAVLVLMSTVLSLNRRWYAAALPARQRFEINAYSLAPKGSLLWLRDLMSSHGASPNADKESWLAVSDALWGNREWTKARILWNLNEYMLRWIALSGQSNDDIHALKSWMTDVPVEQFLGKVKGLAQRAYEQLQWYLDGVTAIKFDVHVDAFVRDVVGRRLSDEQAKAALTDVAAVMRIAPTELDARIWNYMQSRGTSR